MPVIDLTDQSFAAVVDGSDFVLIDFWTPTCAPCRAFAPIFERAAEAHSGITFCRVNVAEEQTIRQAFEIESVPTLAVLRDGILLLLQPGFMNPDLLENVIQRAIALDMDQVREDIAR